MSIMCPDEGMLQAYADRELTINEMDQIENHLEYCEHCQLLLAEIKGEDQWLTTAFQQEAEGWVYPKIMQAVAKSNWTCLGVLVFGILVSSICWLYWPLLFSSEAIWAGGALGWMAVGEGISGLWGIMVQFVLGLIQPGVWGGIDSIIILWGVLPSLGSFWLLYTRRNFFQHQLKYNN